MHPKLQIIGLSGTNGSGKDTVGELLAERHNYLFISVTDILRDELRRRGLPTDRKHMRQLSAQWRREFGLAVLVDRATALFNAKQQKYAGLVMASLRNPYEAERVHELGGSVVWVDADPEVRYDRIQTNALLRGRMADDNKTFEQFLAEEAAEMHPRPGSDEAVLNMAAVRQRADVTILNNYSDVTAFGRAIDKALGL